MKEIYNIQKHSIMLECGSEEGSGVFVSSKSAEYDYIITAKHCLKYYKNKLDIIFPRNSFTVENVFKHDTLDLAIIQVKKSEEVSVFGFINYEELERYNDTISLYGYPKIARNKEIKACRLDCKYYDRTDSLLCLESNEEVSSFRKAAIELLEGMSGGPVYIEKDDVVILVGVYYENTYDDFSYRKINVIPLEVIREMILSYRLADLNLSFFSELISEDLDPLYINYDKLVRDDFRNLKSKIIDISPNYNDKRIGLLSRKVANTAFEIDKLSYKRKAALLYRVFLAANEKQLDLVIEDKKILTESEINSCIDEYTDYAKEIIDDKSEEYKYYLKSRDIIKGIVLQLIDDCYISFDEIGYYYKEGDNN